MPKKQRLTTAQVAAKVLKVMARHPNTLQTIDQVALQARLTVAQVRRGERYLKAWLNQHREELPDWTLHIGLTNRSEHGLIQDPELSYLDAVARVLYMTTRAASEVDYLEQQIDRVEDDETRKWLRRGIGFERSARDAFAAAKDRLSS